MTETSTPSEVDAPTAERREQAAVVLRCVADLHAAYGRDVRLTIDAEREHSTAVDLYHGGNSLTVVFWDDGEVYTPVTDIVKGGHLAALEQLRAFIHRHGKGAR